MTVEYVKSAYENGDYIKSKEVVGEGATLSVFYDTLQVMSDEWAQVLCARYWDGEAIRYVQWVEASSTVDATPEVLEQVRQFIYKGAYSTALSQLQEEAARISKGSEVKVVKGKYSKGASGKVVASITRPYGMGYRAPLRDKLGIATSDEKIKVAAKNGKVYENYKDVVWVWAQNCELLSVPEVDLSQVKERAENATESRLKEVYKAKK